MLNIGERSVRRAREVLEVGVPEPAAKVERGEIHMSAAADIGQVTIEQQREIVARGNERAPPVKPAGLQGGKSKQNDTKSKR
jgi:hypothetical protein